MMGRKELISRGVRKYLIDDGVERVNKSWGGNV